MNQFVWVKFGDVQFFDNLNFRGRASNPDPFLKGYKKLKMKRFFQYEMFFHPDNLINKKFLRTKLFTTNYETAIPPKKKSSLRETDLFKNRDCLGQNATILKLSTAAENCSCMQKVWEQEKGNHRETFCASAITKTLFQQWQLCNQWSSFITTE